MTKPIDRLMLDTLTEWIKNEISEDEDYVNSIALRPAYGKGVAKIALMRLDRVKVVTSLMIDAGFPDTRDEERAKKILEVVDKRRNLFNTIIRFVTDFDTLTSDDEEDYNI